MTFIFCIFYQGRKKQKSALCQHLLRASSLSSKHEVNTKSAPIETKEGEGTLTIKNVAFINMLSDYAQARYEV